MCFKSFVASGLPGVPVPIENFSSLLSCSPKVRHRKCSSLDFENHTNPEEHELKKIHLEPDQKVLEVMKIVVFFI